MGLGLQQICQSQIPPAPTRRSSKPDSLYCPATFPFSGADIKGSGEWKKEDGRIWLGNFVAEDELNLN